MISNFRLSPNPPSNRSNTIRTAYLPLPSWGLSIHLTTTTSPAQPSIMAPIEPDLSNSNLRPLSIFSGYLILATTLIVFIAYRVLYRAYTTLPPSQATRLRTSNRNKHVQIFGALAIVSLALTWHHMLSFFALSYRVWAHQIGEPVPMGLWGEGGIFTSEEERGVGFALGRWLSDTSLMRDAWEIVIEKSRRY